MQNKQDNQKPDDTPISRVEAERRRRRELREERASEREKRRRERQDKRKKGASLRNNDNSFVEQGDPLDRNHSISFSEEQCKSLLCTDRTENDLNSSLHHTDLGITSESKDRNQESDVEYSSMDSEPGFCHYLLQSTANTIHLIQLISGCIILGYGIALSVHVLDRQHLSAVVCYTWSMLLIASSTLGITGLASPRLKRIGLSASIYLALIIILWDLILFSFLMIDKSHVLDYISRHSRSFYLGNKEISFLKKNFSILVSCLIASAIVELCRFKTLLTLRDDLEFHDAELLVENRRNESQRRIAARRRWTRNPEDSTTPLISGTHGDENNVEEADTSLSDVSPIFPGEEKKKKNWWEDIEEENSKEEDASNVKATWLPNLFQSSQKQTSITSSAFDEESSFGNNFAPIEEDIDMESLSWIKESKSKDSSIIVEEDSVPDLDWAKDQESDRDPDLSWANNTD